MTSIEEYINYLEKEGLLDPNCKSCQEWFYPRIKDGMHFTDVFAPRHKALMTCRSGKHPHCTCDSCF